MSLSTSSNEMASERDLDAELLKVIASARRTLANRDCQLKIIWGRIEAGEYFESADAFTIPEAMAWAQVRADSIDSWEQPERHLDFRSFYAKQMGIHSSLTLIADKDRQ